MTTRRLLLSMSLVWACSGVLDALMRVPPTQQSPLALVYWCVMAVLIHRWCRSFAQAVGREPRPGIPALAALLTPVGLPVYLFQVLPVTRAALAIVAAIGVLGGMLVIYAVADALVRAVAA